MIVVVRRATRSTRSSTTRSARSPRTACAGIWGTLACGLFTLPALAEYNAVGDRGLVYTRLVPPARRPGARRRGRVLLRVRLQPRACSGVDQEDLRPARHARRRRMPVSTSPSTACTATRSSSSRRPSSSATARPPQLRSAGRHRPRRAPTEVHGMKKVEAYIRHEAFEPIRMELLDARLPLADDHRGQGLRPAEGDHRDVPRRGADELPAAEGQARVRRRRRGRADDRRHDPQARPHRRRR